MKIETVAIGVPRVPLDQPWQAGRRDGGAQLVSGRIPAALSRARPATADGAPAVPPGGGFGSELDPAAVRRFTVWKIHYVQDRFQGNGEVPSSNPVRPFRYAVKI